MSQTFFLAKNRRLLKNNSGPLNVLRSQEATYNKTF